ncbi:hypothetical protein [Anaeromicropila populeti]|uniref:Uncharacterized protein n=1 Tax=Anaeromicropila populeti TaxID=37658 RepID=A0A1I6JSU4_9FIRM|nr:hypothetical protein [Anaeromicropila populeti]SFR82049.1 hypothetical protein SAMN05661086_01970 [Anaeromicropila populeti]
MNMLNATNPLIDMEKQLGEILQKDIMDVRIIADLGLSHEDYKILSLKLRGMARYNGEMRLLEKYKICLMTMWVLACKYEKDGETIWKFMNNLVNDIPQYMQRNFYSICDSTLRENGLSSYGLIIDNMDNLMQMLVIQSGIDDMLYPSLFGLLEKAADYENAEEEIFKLFGKDRYSYLKTETKHELLLLMKAVYEDCQQGRISQKQILEKHHELSKGFICNCYKWCRSHIGKENVQIVR